jgi:hypothetical protein
MIEGLSKLPTPIPKGEVYEGDANHTVECVVLAGANAIHRLIADRDSFRNHANAQQQDLVALSAINNELRGRLALVRCHYVELATNIIAQLERFDRATRDAVKESDYSP